MNPAWWRERIPFLAIVAAAMVLWLAAFGWGLRKELVPNRSWEPEIVQFERRDLTNPPPDEAVLFVGSSSVKLWETIRSDFPRYRVFRRGFGGAHMADVVKYAQRVILPYDLEMVVIHAGGNDIAAGHDPEYVVDRFKELVQIIHRTEPTIRVAFLSLKPSPSRWTLRHKLAEVNHLIQEFTKTNDHLVYIDVYEKMLGPNGEARPELFASDGLHLSQAGYRIWADTVRPFLPETARKRMNKALKASPVQTDSDTKLTHRD